MKDFVPRPYQKRIIERIVCQPRTMIWAGMGCGKTVSTLTALDPMLFMGMGPALIVAPLRVAQSTWPDEVAKWKHLAHLKVSVVCGGVNTRRRALEEPADIYCTNFEQLPWLVEHFGKEWPFKIVVVDEATRLKGFRLRQGSQRAKALARVYSLIDRFIELTGTPAANGLIDLWGQAWFIDKGERLGKSMTEYETRFFRPVRTGNEAYMVKYVPVPGADEQIKALLADVSLTVRAEDYFDIDEPIINDIYVDLPKNLMQKYKELERDLYARLGETTIEAANAQAALNKCIQFASGAVYVGRNEFEPIHNVKLDALQSVIEEANGAPVLVVYQYRHEIARIRERFPQARQFSKDPQMVRDWNAGKIPILLIHPASGGHGLNLQDGGNILCFFSSGFNYEQYAQVIERIGPTRQAQSGHPRAVFVHRIITRGTADEAVYKALSRKQNVLDYLMGVEHGSH